MRFLRKFFEDEIDVLRSLFGKKQQTTSQKSDDRSVNSPLSPPKVNIPIDQVYPGIANKMQSDKQAVIYAKTSDSYIDECFDIDFASVGRDDRHWRDIPEAESIVDLANSGRTEEAILHANGLMAKATDFYFSYYWIGSLLSDQKRYNEARTALKEGYKRCPRKYDLCDMLARVELESGNLPEAVKWWIRSLVIRVTTDSFEDPDPFLYLSYVAKVLGLFEASAELRAKSHQIRHVELDSSTASRLTSAVRLQDSESLKEAICLASSKLMGSSSNIALTSQGSQQNMTEAQIRVNPKVREALNETFAWAEYDLEIVMEAAEKMVAAIDDVAALTLLGREAKDWTVRYEAVKKLKDQIGLAQIVRAELSRSQPNQDVLSAVTDKLTDQTALELLVTKAPFPRVRDKVNERLTELSANASSSEEGNKADQTKQSQNAGRMPWESPSIEPLLKPPRQ
jgi:tetratricopeptide (TPR) repeat protein